MLFSRFWYVVLALAAVTGFAIALSAASVVNRRSDDALTESLARDRVELELLLRVEARARLDSLASVAAQPEVRSALRDASTRDRVEPSAKLSERLRVLNSSLNEVAGDLLLAVDAEGRIVGSHGVTTTPPGSGLGRTPLVERALAGYLRDDVWVLRDVPYRMAAVPVTDGGAYVGAVVHAMRVNDRLAQRLSESLDGTTVAFFYGDRLVAHHMPARQGAVRASDLGTALASARDTERFKAGKRTDPLDIAGGRAVFSPVTGAAAARGVAYGLARPRQVIAPGEVFGLLTRDDALPTNLVGILAAFAVLGVLVGMLGVWLERDRPLAALMSSIGAISKELARGERLSPGDYRGRTRALAMAINDLLDRAAAEGGGPGQPKKAANIDRLLDHAAPVEGPSQFFGFAGGGAPAASAASAEPAPAPPAAPAPAPKPPRPAAAPPASPPAPRAARAEVATSPAAPALTDQDDLPTIAGDAHGDAKGTAPRAAAALDDEEAHFREVFERFVLTKKQCGESTEGTTYERFLLTLRKNKEAIMAKHGVTRVHFAVQVKDGKASLKATPVK